MNITDIIAQHAQDTPDAPAVIEGGRTWSYRQFDAAIWRAAAGLRQRGVEPGQVVGLSLPDGALHLVAGYALARLGAVQLSLPLRETVEARRQLAARFHATRVVVLSNAAGVDGLPFDKVDPSWLEPGDARAIPELRSPGGDLPWKIAMTSGTTGSPKATLQTHAQHIAWRRLNQAVVPVLPGDRYLAVVSLDFFAGFRMCTDMHWVGAAAVVGERLDTAADLPAAIARHGVTYLYLTPVHLRRLLEFLPADGTGLAGVKRLRTGSMVVDEQLRREVLARLGVDLVVAYGTNDVGSPFTLATGDTLERFPESVGFPVPGVEVQVVDGVGRALPAGETGEIRVRLEGMPRAYIDSPDASARAFRDGWYHPGDLGVMSAEGALYFRGRTDDLMNFDGLKVYPLEIESVLLSHPDVAEAAAFPLPSAAHQDLPVAAVVLRGAVSAAALRGYCGERLGPRAPISIAVLRALPRTPAGKVDKRRLAAVIQEKMQRGRQT